MSNFRITDHFVDRHIGPNEMEQQDMLNFISADSLDVLMTDTIPEAIRLN